jgi:glucose-6-phosphate isomerase
MAPRRSLKITPGRVQKTYQDNLKTGARLKLVPGMMHRNAEVFSRNRELREAIAGRLGWVDVASKMKRRVSDIETFGRKVIEGGLKHVVLCGMGGSSLCPEVFGRMFGTHAGIDTYQIIDSTDPAAVKAVLRKIELQKTLFIVASKSGSTVETRSQEAFFAGQLRDAGIEHYGRHFAAITDQGSALQKFARKHKYRKVFINPSDIGGRYSALSYFGLVPAFFAGVDLNRLLAEAVVMEKLLREREDDTNPALQLGAFMAGAAREGIDKMTVVASKKVVPFVAWIEQLVAESTGKRKKGVVPVEGESLGKPGDYGKDRFFVTIKVGRQESPLSVRFKYELARRKTPLVEVSLGDRYDLGKQFLLWEAATAAAGRLLAINPFDEPNVTESKNNTNKILGDFEQSGVLQRPATKTRWSNLALLAAGGPEAFTSVQMKDPATVVKKFLARARPPKYLALLNYFKSDGPTERLLTVIRNKLRSKTGMAILRGYGPRYLHSVGQLYKGGPPDGIFIFFVRADYPELKIPGRPYGFNHLIMAQAIGDAQALMKRKLPTLVIAIKGSPARGIEEFVKVVNRALK